MFDLEALREQREAERAEAHTAPPEIANCPYCDPDGYRNSTGLICDHKNHRPAYDVGMAAIRAVLQKRTDHQTEEGN